MGQGVQVGGGDGWGAGQGSLEHIKQPRCSGRTCSMSWLLMLLSMLLAARTASSWPGRVAAAGAAAASDGRPAAAHRAARAAPWLHCRIAVTMRVLSSMAMIAKEGLAGGWGWEGRREREGGFGGAMCRVESPSGAMGLPIAALGPAGPSQAGMGAAHEAASLAALHTALCVLCSHFVHCAFGATHPHSTALAHSNSAPSNPCTLAAAEHREAHCTLVPGFEAPLDASTSRFSFSEWPLRTVSRSARVVPSIDYTCCPRAVLRAAVPSPSCRHPPPPPPTTHPPTHPPHARTGLVALYSQLESARSLAAVGDFEAGRAGYAAVEAGLRSVAAAAHGPSGAQAWTALLGQLREERELLAAFESECAELTALAAERVRGGCGVVARR